MQYGEKSRREVRAEHMNSRKKNVREHNIQQMLTPESTIYIRTYRNSDTSAYDIQLERLENDEIVEIIKAKRMEMVEPPFQWKLHDYSVRTFEDENQNLTQYKNEGLDTTLFIKQDYLIQTDD